MGSCAGIAYLLTGKFETVSIRWFRWCHQSCCKSPCSRFRIYP